MAQDQKEFDQTAAKYVTILTRNGVLVKVPSPDCKYMKLVPAHSFKTRGGTEVKVEEHHKHGQLIGGVIVNRHFFGLNPADLGRRIIATVEVVIKTTGDGKKFTMLNIRKEPETTWASHKLVIAEKQTKGAGDIRVKKTTEEKPVQFISQLRLTNEDKMELEGFIHFEPLPSKEEVEAAREKRIQERAAKSAT